MMNLMTRSTERYQIINMIILWVVVFVVNYKILIGFAYNALIFPLTKATFLKDSIKLTFISRHGRGSAVFVSWVELTPPFIGEFYSALKGVLSTFRYNFTHAASGTISSPARLKLPGWSVKSLSAARAGSVRSRVILKIKSTKLFLTRYRTVELPGISRNSGTTVSTDSHKLIIQPAGGLV